MSIELHCHTLFSVDGRGTPEAAVDAAAARGVAAISVTEHNHLGSLQRAAARAGELGMRYFAGIELDARFGERHYHFLGYGFDPCDDALHRLAARNHACYPRRFEVFFGKLLEAGCPFPREEFDSFLLRRYPTLPSPVPNTWAWKDFVEQKGGCAGYEEMNRQAQEWLAAQMRRAAQDAAQGGAAANTAPPPEGLEFCRFEEVRDAIHAAGGLVLFAHPGKALPRNPDAQDEMVRAAMAEGADGFELYHWANRSQGDFGRLERLAQELDCVVSGGSDCHDAPGTAPKAIGTCGAPDETADRLAEALSAANSRRAGISPPT